LGVMSARQLDKMSFDFGIEYVDSVIKDAIRDYEKEGVRHPFSGVYFYKY